MLLARLAKTAMVASVAAFALLVAYDNIVDYGTNWEFVRHVLAMDTVFPNSVLKSRAITNPTLQMLGYWAIIATEALTGLVLAYAALRMATALKAPAREFTAAKQWVVVGVGLGFVLWFGGFAVVGGEWFAAWQSKEWNGVASAFRFYMTLLAVAILVSLPDGEIDA
jgi:predicted small integral membrane protein